MKIVLALTAWGLWQAGRPGWSVLAGLAVVLIYVGQCVFWPFGHCWACHGSGRWYRNRTRKHFRDCLWCRGSGRRLRIVRRLWNRVRAVQKKAG